MLDLANELSAPASQTRKCGRAMGQTVRQVVSGEASSEAGEAGRHAAAVVVVVVLQHLI